MSISRLQGTYNSGTGLIASLAYGSNLTANSLLLASVTWGGGGSSSGNPTVTDSLGNTWTLIQSAYDTSEKQGWAMFYAVNTHGAAANTVNVNYPSEAIGYGGLLIDEFSGCAISSVLDGSVVQDQQAFTGGTNAVSSGSFTPSTNGDLIYVSTGSVGEGNSTLSPGTGFTAGEIVTSFWGDTGPFAGSEYLIQATAGGIAGTFTCDGTGIYFITIAAAFKASGGSVYNVSASLSATAKLAPGSAATMVGSASLAAKAALAGSSITTMIGGVALSSRAGFSEAGNATMAASVALALSAFAAYGATTGQVWAVNVALAAQAALQGAAVMATNDGTTLSLKTIMGNSALASMAAQVTLTEVAALQGAAVMATNDGTTLSLKTIMGNSAVMATNDGTTLSLKTIMGNSALASMAAQVTLTEVASLVPASSAVMTAATTLAARASMMLLAQIPGVGNFLAFIIDDEPITFFVP
ncbi:MAG: hypothetical protein ABSC19_05040 [Syntrophorhabdales bacterium]